MYLKKHINLSFSNSAEITEFYRSLQVDYPKFFKMDGLSKLGFLASELLFKDDEKRFVSREDVAIVCFNRSSSLDIDMSFQATVNDNEMYFPSPSLFVYTLPNIVTGEISIRNHFFGETSFFICREFDAQQMVRIVQNTFLDETITTVLVAWIESFKETNEALMMLVERGKDNLDFSRHSLELLFYEKNQEK